MNYVLTKRVRIRLWLRLVACNYAQFKVIAIVSTCNMCNKHTVK